MTSAQRRVASPRVVCIADLRPIAYRRLPKSVFDYLDGGAAGEITLRENRRVFQYVTFRPRDAVAVPVQLQRGAWVRSFSAVPAGSGRLQSPNESGRRRTAAGGAGNAGTAHILSRPSPGTSWRT